MLITLVLVPATPMSWLLSFLAFRVLDINKPWLIGTAERRLRGGVAIMADDALAVSLSARARQRLSVMGGRKLAQAVERLMT